MFRSVALPWLVALALVSASAHSAHAVSGCVLRAPQVSFNSTTLQNDFNSGIDPGINLLTDQLDNQLLVIPQVGNSDFTLWVKLTHAQPPARVGLYSASDPTGTPTLYPLFPDSAQSFWSAICNMKVDGRLSVTMFDQNYALQGQVIYSGFNRTVIGWYLQNAGGTYYSQDARNSDLPQVLTYAGTEVNRYDLWECLDGAAYHAGTSTFTGAVLMVEAVVSPFPDSVSLNPCLTPPVPVHTSTWGSLKAAYR